MGRSPCCDKVGLKKGPWTPEEDQQLLAYIEEHGYGSWHALPAKAGLQRCGKSCRLRWTNYLRPDIKRGKFSLQEEQTIIQLHALLGNRWSAIATHLPKRTDNEIKNYWNTHLKKRLTKMGIDPVTHKPKSNAFGPSKGAANLSHMAQWESARLEAEARLVRESKLLPNSFQPHQIRNYSLSASAQLLNKAPPPPFTVPPCLDVLKACQGVWSKPIRDISTFFASTTLESPTSTLNFSDQTTFALSNVGLGGNNLANNSSACDGGVMKDFSLQNEWICMGATTKSHNSPNPMEEFHHRHLMQQDPTDVTLIADPLKLPNLMEGLTDILLDNVDGHDINNNSSSAGGHADAVVGICGGDFEENKNYWNSILNFVNTSPSGSPVF